MRRVAGILLCAACAKALHEPPPLEAIARPSGRGAGELIARADAAWARRGEPGQAAAASELYLQAARADPQDPNAFAGAIRADAFRIGREKDGGARKRLAEGAVVVGQLCEEHIPRAPACDYWLAAALGLQARERTSTAKDALSKMNELLRSAIRGDPALDHGGPHRLLAIVLLRAPSWPLGPGNPEAALPEAEAAVRVDPRFPPNQLALGEALAKNGRAEEARAAYERARSLADSPAFRTDPDAPGWADDARAGLR